MKYDVTQLEGKNEPVNFSHSVLGNYFIELELGNYQAKEANNGSNTHPGLLQFSWANKIDCNIVNLVSDVGSSTSTVELVLLPTSETKLTMLQM